MVPTTPLGVLTIIPKRKPPSQRPELKRDETAEAIARLREEGKAENKPEKANRLAAAAKPQASHVPTNSAGHRKSAQAAPAPTTKRQKSGGG